MKKFSFLISIIAACMMSFNASASYQTATPIANFFINDPNWVSGDQYDVAVEVISLYPSDSYAIVGSFTVANQWFQIPSSITLNNVWYQGPPISTSYYIMKIWVSKNGGTWRYGWSNASMTSVPGAYYVTAYGNITISV